MDITKRDEMFDILCRLSDRQCDPIVKKRIKTLMGRPNEEIKDELLGIIDDAVYSSLTSNFEIMAMNHIWQAIGGTAQELAARNALLDTEDPSERKELQERFKWQCAGFHD